MFLKHLSIEDLISYFYNGMDPLRKRVADLHLSYCVLCSEKLEYLAWGELTMESIFCTRTKEIEANIIRRKPRGKFSLQHEVIQNILRASRLKPVLEELCQDVKAKDWELERVLIRLRTKLVDAQLDKENPKKPLVLSFPTDIEWVPENYTYILTLILLSRQKVIQEHSSKLAMRTSTVEQKEEKARKDVFISWHAPRGQKDILFVPNKDLVSARLFLQDKIIFKEENWPAQKERPIPAELIVKNPQAPMKKWEFKDEMLWGVKSRTEAGYG